MGEKVSTNLRHAGLPDQEKHKCSKCGMEKADSDNGCCHDEKVVIKGAKEALSGLPFIQVTLGIADVLPPNFTLNSDSLPVYTPYQVTSFQPAGPPGYSSQPLFILNCIFLI
nr:hypothetical protein [Flavipsychrobacter sp. JY13-12]